MYAKPWNEMSAADVDVAIAMLETRLAQGGYPSADAYYSDKDDLRRLRAKKLGKTEIEVDPMGFWFGMPSN